MRVAAIQMNSQSDFEKNLEFAEALLESAARQGARYALLPENFAFFGNEQEKLALAPKVAERTSEFLSQNARRFGMVITGGGYPQLAGADKVYNSAITFDTAGQIMARYDKVHLFDATPGDTISYRESNSTAVGATKLATFTVEGFRIGMSVCYDVRFPALYRRYAQMHADILCVPAAFTQLTGAAHWHTLLRARAIENTCYVIAAAQTGSHTGERKTYGHSLIVDPWGEILAELPENAGVITAQIDPKRLADVRRRMPSLAHDRFSE